MKDTSKRNIIITGGEFNNKGAQAMSFITISRLKSKFPEHNIVFASDLDAKRSEEETDIYNFDIISNPLVRNNFVGENIIRKILKKNLRENPKKFNRILDDTDYLFDISGYALSSQWGIRNSRGYLKKFRLAYQRGIKSAILPQSFGPFDYGKNNLRMKKEIIEVLSKVDIVMPRENEGMQFLHDLGLVDNIFYSPDLVLTNKEKINWNHIYKKPIAPIDFEIPKMSVAIVPNMRNFDHGNREKIYSLYELIIEELLKKKMNVYLIRHSGEDLEACKNIKNLFDEKDNVRIISNDLTPSEFENLISKFEFSIGSRFHSIVHSYQVATPCIILGWATKYKELAEYFDQSDYVFDVRHNINTSLFIEIMNNLINKIPEEKSKIEFGLKKIFAMSDPFDKAFKVITKE
ncbi:polysaccharide pyruvyl transferase family protein [Enterococcus sp. DIV0170]|uniref:polysaccharide pyruvyl transferase family protein n=1 Tax=Enterococcus sp. DIV0170 TaxID=2774642 RepID=UPI003F1F5D35